jgi:hypothetical protein
VAQGLTPTVKVIGVLQAYFDESGTSGNDPLTVISGFIATDACWLDFDALWRSALKRDLKDLGLAWFHMVECENGTKQFAPWASRPEFRRFAAKSMADVIVRSGITGFWSSVGVQDWRDATTDTFKARYPKPYYFCFEDCLRQVAAWVSEFAPGKSVELIFAEQHEYQDRAVTTYGAYMKGKPSAPRQSVRFAPMQICAPLQAADMAVYCTNKQTVADLFGKETKERIYRSALDVLYWNAGSFTGGHHDALSLTISDDPS